MRKAHRHWGKWSQKPSEEMATAAAGGQADPWHRPSCRCRVTSLSARVGTSGVKDACHQTCNPWVYRSAAGPWPDYIRMRAMCQPIHMAQAEQPAVDHQLPRAPNSSCIHKGHYKSACLHLLGDPISHKSTKQILQWSGVS